MSHLSNLISSIFERRTRNTAGKRLGRHKVRDSAFTYRMGAGVPGTVSRMNPAAVIEPVLLDPTNPPTAFGVPVYIVAASQGAAKLNAANVATDVYGIMVRPYPIQQTTGGPNSTFGGGAPGVGASDVLRSGYILGMVNVSGGAAVKGAQVYIWTAVSGGGHTQGGFETAATGGSTILLTNGTFNGGVDAYGVGEICYNV